MRIVILALAFVVSAQAGTIKGVVLEHASSRPIARTLVRLDPLPQPGGALGRALQTRAGHAGQFVFADVEPGVYLIEAVREGFFDAAYGQRLPTGWAMPVEVTDTSLLVATLRLRHKGALTGQVLDENGVGMAGVEVVAYRARLPLRVAGRGESDDRGTYRIAGLDAGKYWVRSASRAFDDGSEWLPTFAPRGEELREALPYDVLVDADTEDVDIEPAQGTLFEVGGRLICHVPGPVIVTLSSETGRRSVEGSCRGGYLFEDVAAGDYEIFATLRDGSAAGFSEYSVRRNTQAANVRIGPLPTFEIEVRRSGSGDAADIPFQLLGRRQDLSEMEPARVIEGPSVTLAPGHWEFRAIVPPGHYVESIVQLYGSGRRRSDDEKISDWFPVFVPTRSSFKLRISVSDESGRITGQAEANSRPSPGTPVFLWPVAVAARRGLSQPVLQMWSDAEGRFQFDSLPPGDYRLLATFDVKEVDAELIELSQAAVVSVGASQATDVELPVWVAPW